MHRLSKIKQDQENNFKKDVVQQPLKRGRAHFSDWRNFARGIYIQEIVISYCTNEIPLTTLAYRGCLTSPFEKGERRQSFIRTA